MAEAVLPARRPWRRVVAAAELLLCALPLAGFLVPFELMCLTEGWRELDLGLSRQLQQPIQEGAYLLLMGLALPVAMAGPIGVLVTVLRHGRPRLRPWHLVSLAVWVVVMFVLRHAIHHMRGVLPFTILTAIAMHHQALDAWWSRVRRP